MAALILKALHILNASIIVCSCASSSTQPRLNTRVQLEFSRRLWPKTTKLQTLCYTGFGYRYSGTPGSLCRYRTAVLLAYPLVLSVFAALHSSQPAEHSMASSTNYALTIIDACVHNQETDVHAEYFVLNINTYLKTTSTQVN